MESRFDTLRNGLKIHSLTAGSRDHLPLVLLHGYPTNAYLWRHCIPELSKHFMVYAPDLPGHGQSDKNLDAGYDLDFFVDFLFEYFEKMNISKAHLAVHDLGGMIGLGFASRYQNRIDKFIVMDTLPYKEWPETMVKFYSFVQSSFWSKILLIKPVFAYSFFRDKAIVYNSKAISKETVNLYHSQWSDDRISRKAFSRVLCASPEDITEPRNNIKRIDIPTLVLWGENDSAMDTSLAQSFAADLPDSELVIIPECGHFLPEEQPVVVTNHMVKFLLKLR